MVLSALASHDVIVGGPAPPALNLSGVIPVCPEMSEPLAAK